MNSYNQFVKDNYYKVDSLPNHMRFTKLGQMWQHTKQTGGGTSAETHAQGGAYTACVDKCYQKYKQTYSQLSGGDSPDRTYEECINKCIAISRK